MLTILAGVATGEPEIVLEQQRDGIAELKAEGKYKGRTPIVAWQIDEIRAMHANGLGAAAIARQHICGFRLASTGRLASWKCLKGRRCVVGAAAGSREGYRLLSEIPVILRRSGRAAFFCMGDAVADRVGVVGKQTGCVM
jgi:hypothetical protein